MKFWHPNTCVVFLWFLMLFSCAETAEDTTTVLADEQNVNTRYGTTLPELPKISEVAKIETVTWSVFDDFEINVTSISNSTVATLKNKSSQMAQQTDSLLQKIPSALDTRPIYARVILANTRAKILDQQAHYDRIDSLGLETSLQEMNLAAANLFIEINRTFKKNQIDEALKETEKKELEQQKRFLDSVYKAEIEDNN